MNLIEHLQQIRDFQTKPDYPLWVILLLAIMGTMSGYAGYRPLAEFVTRHQAELLELLKLPHSRLPSLTIFGGSWCESILSPLPLRLMPTLAY